MGKRKYVGYIVELVNDVRVRVRVTYFYFISDLTSWHVMVEIITLKYKDSHNFFFIVLPRKSKWCSVAFWYKITVI